jgi:hypothetical protein
MLDRWQQAGQCERGFACTIVRQEGVIMLLFRRTFTVNRFFATHGPAVVAFKTFRRMNETRSWRA